MEIVNLNKKVYAKNQYEKVIDTKFSQLATTPTSTPTVSIEAQITAFFASYDQLFYDIPKFGPTDSHEYLIKTSSEYINFVSINDDIQALIEEINALQAQNLELNQQLADLQIANVATSKAEAEQAQASLQAQKDNALSAVQGRDAGIAALNADRG